MSLSPDTSEATVTEREAVKRERAAFEAGVLCLHVQPEIPGGVETSRAVDCALERIHKRYPLPKVSRPRVVKDPEQGHRMWRFFEGRMQVSSGPGWYDAHEWFPTADRIRVWADLLAQPNELVEDE